MRRLPGTLAMGLMLATLASGAGSAMAAPFGPNPTPNGCVGGAAAPLAIENNGLAILVIDPGELTPGVFWHDLATVECAEEGRP